MTPKEIADLKLECLKLALTDSEGNRPLDKAIIIADKYYAYITSIKK